MIEFTYDAYKHLLDLLQTKGYTFTNYRDYHNYEKCVILRHDIDYSIDKAVELAKLEQRKAVLSTYFVLLSSTFYNLLNKDVRKKLSEIDKMGYEIGLHFDEMNYSVDDYEKAGSFEDVVRGEAKLLSEILGHEVKSVSMHRPSKKTLDANYTFGNELVNSYSKTFFHEFKYLSDSRRMWREDVESIIQSDVYDRLHILTHAFWYAKYELDLSKTIRLFVNNANVERYCALEDNFTDLVSIMPEERIIR